MAEGYAQLELENYAQLSLEEYSQLPLASTSSGDDDTGGSSSVSCLWTEARIASIESRLASIESALAKLATSAELTSALNAILAQCKTAAGFATSEALLAAREDILSTVSLYASAVPENVWKYSEGRTVETSTLAQASELAEVRALLDHWSVSGNTLTTYDTAGNTLSVHSLTRDGDGNIVAINH